MKRVRWRWGGAVFLVAVLLCGSVGVAEAARIGELTTGSALLERMGRFISLQDAGLRTVLLGTMLLGLCSGVMGAFLVVRKLALMGDALSHAVLPGVALGFLWNMSRDPVAIFVGATLAGLLGAGTVQWIRQTTKHKEDAALGFVLASFFGLGICLLTMIQGLPGGQKSGLDQFLFGQAAAMGGEDVVLLGGVALVTICGVGIFYKELLLTSFDGGFARSLGWPVKVFHYGLMLLLAFAIVSALQAVGVVLVSALLVIPAAAAFLLTQRFGWMLILSAGFGILAGVGGVMVSFVGTNLPTGPYMVLAAAGIFTMAFLFAPTQGLVPRWWRMRSRTSRIARENTLKALYHALEDEDFRREIVGVGELAQRRRQTLEQAGAALAEAERAGWVTSSENAVSFTPAGWQRACEIVRNHRLWELYLTHAAQMAPDHVHDDAERIEHVLGEETVWQLEKRLNYARRDPHGKLIPGRDDIRIGPRAFAVSSMGEPKP